MSSDHPHRIVHPALVFRLVASWLMFATWAAVLGLGNSGLTAPLFLFASLVLRWGTERYTHGEPRFFRVVLYGLLVLLLALFFNGPSDIHSAIRHPVGIATLIAFVSFTFIAIYRDYLIATGRVTREPLSSPISHDA